MKLKLTRSRAAKRYALQFAVHEWFQNSADSSYGDLSATSGDPDQWFDFQHGVSY